MHCFLWRRSARRLHIFYIFDFQHELPLIIHEFSEIKFMKNLWFVCDNSCFSSFFLSLFIFSLFLPLPFREKSEWPEKAHSSLCSSLVNLAHSLHEKRVLKSDCFHCYVCIHIPNINSGAIPLFIIFLFRECKPYQRK